MSTTRCTVLLAVPCVAAAARFATVSTASDVLRMYAWTSRPTSPPAAIQQAAVSTPACRTHSPASRAFSAVHAAAAPIARIAPHRDCTGSAIAVPPTSADVVTWTSHGELAALASQVPSSIAAISPPTTACAALLIFPPLSITMSDTFRVMSAAMRAAGR
ncbi:hypothetical protein Vafri_3340 [Volvox africanus]|uniref:Secreted protein n=1 Tax=Volvox africanus TaxID=51714 RepID=A0A8J4ARS3_9CHLO|nr:hypothetical protein Vafri_3340 [Volvox africanus]